VSWTRHQGKALADTTLSGDALHAELEDYLRLQNPHLTDLRLERATATKGHDTGVQPARRWYEVTYLAQDPTANS
jgi:hypothetical protein